MRTLLLKLCGLFSSVGGPVFWADALKPGFGIAWSFAVTFAPVGMMLLGMAAISDKEPPTLLSRGVVWLGIAGAALLTLLNLGALWKIVGGFSHPNQTMVLFGMVVGTLATGWFAKEAYKFFRKPNAGTQRSSGT